MPKEKEVKKDTKVTFIETPFDANLKVPLTSKEIMDEAEKMARLQTEISGLESEASSVSKRYKSQIEERIAQQDVCAGLIRDKFSYRSVRCIRRMDWSTGTVIETRMDTGEVFQRRPMTVAESQLQMKLEAEEAAKKQEEKKSAQVQEPEPPEDEGQDDIGDEEL